MNDERATTIQGNPGRPTGEAGQAMLARMNKSHGDLTNWGLGFFGLPTDAQVLDVGCGGGATLLRLLERYPQGHISGVDHSEVSVASSLETCQAEVASGKINVQLASVEALPFSSGTFDGACAVESFYFWPNRIESLKEVRRVLKPKGTLLIIADTYDNGKLDAAAIEAIEQFNLFVPTPEHMERLLTRAGFAEVAVHVLSDKHWMCAEGRA